MRKKLYEDNKHTSSPKNNKRGCLCKDGKTLVVLSTSGVPLFDAEGNFIGYRGADMDITDQYIAEKKLQVSEEHLRSLMESASGFAIYRLVYDKVSPHSLRVIFVSPSIKGIFGIPDPMKFKSWFENIHPDDVNRLTKANKRAFETNRFNEEFRTYNEKKGEWRWGKKIFQKMFIVLIQQKFNF